MAGYLVIGAGKFGRSIAKTLYRHNETVLVIDKNEELIQQIIDDGTVGEAVSFDVTEENSLKKMVNSDDFEVAFICIEGSLQTSALVTVMLKELGIKTVFVNSKDLNTTGTKDDKLIEIVKVLKGDYYFIPLSKASEWGDYPSVRCNFVFKDGTKRQITFETDDTTSAQTPCAYRTGGEDEECLKLKIVTDIPIN